MNSHLINYARDKAKFEADINGVGERLNSEIAIRQESKDRWWSVKLAGLGVLFAGIYEGIKWLISRK